MAAGVLMFTDSHCHLDDKRFAEDLDAVLDRAAAAGVTRILTIGTGNGPPEIDRAVRLADTLSTPNPTPP